MTYKYSVIFTGKIIDGLDINYVKNNVSVELNLAVEEVNQLFNLAPRTIKKYSTQERADKLVSVFKACGAIAEIEAQDISASVIEASGDNQDEVKIEIKLTEEDGATEESASEVIKSRRVKEWIGVAMGVLVLIWYFAPPNLLESNDDTFKRAMSAYEKNNFVDALKLLEPLADNEFAAAQSTLGVMFEQGNGVTKDEVEAVKLYRKAAEQGYAKAQINLGLMLSNGNGVAKDDSEAIKWFRRAADQGNARAQMTLGSMFYSGDGVAVDEEESLKWMRKSAEEGYADAQTTLGIMFANGDGVAKDETEAFKWYRKAAYQGNADAQTEVGFMLANGRGVTRDSAEAVKWYRKAADQGYARGQSNLAVMFENGYGVSRDNLQALRWYRKAADQGNAQANKSISRLAKQEPRKSYVESVLDRLALSSDMSCQIYAGHLRNAIGTAYEPGILAKIENKECI